MAARAWIESHTTLSRQGVRLTFEQISRGLVSEVAVQFDRRMLDLHRMGGAYNILRCDLAGRGYGRARGGNAMGFIGLEEIFLAVKDMEKALDFYHNKLGIPIDKRDAERTYLQCEKSHVVLQIENSTGRHQGGGPFHFAFTVAEDTFDKVAASFVG